MSGERQGDVGLTEVFCRGHTERHPVGGDRLNVEPTGGDPDVSHRACAEVTGPQLGPGRDDAQPARRVHPEVEVGGGRRRGLAGNVRRRIG